MRLGIGAVVSNGTISQRIVLTRAPNASHDISQTQPFRIIEQLSDCGTICLFHTFTDISIRTRESIIITDLRNRTSDIVEFFRKFLRGGCHLAVVVLWWLMCCVARDFSGLRCDLLPPILSQLAARSDGVLIANLC